jgi:hypothetical protein
VSAQSHSILEFHEFHTQKVCVCVCVCVGVCEPFFGWVSEVGGLSGVLSVCLCLERLEAL